MTREELIDLVKRIKDPKYTKTDEELHNLFELLERNVPHPAPTNLIYHTDLSVEEIVDKALSYKPIQL